MYDSKAVVWRLMREAVNGNAALERGIRNMGGTCWKDWLALYHDATPAPEQGLFESPIR